MKHTVLGVVIPHLMILPIVQPDLSLHCYKHGIRLVMNLTHTHTFQFVSAEFQSVDLSEIHTLTRTFSYK